MNQNFPFDHFLKATFDQNNSNIFNNKETVETTKQVAATDTNEEFFSTEELNLINDEIHNTLKSLINVQKYNAFFNNALSLTNITLDSLEFSVPSNLIKSMVEKNSEQIGEAVRNALGKEYNIVINVSEQAGPTGFTSNIDRRAQDYTTNKPKSARDVSFTLDLNQSKNDLLTKVESVYIDHMNPEQPGMIIDPVKTFDNFVVGPSNNLANAAAIAIAKNPGKDGKYPSLYIYSNSGLGKTHLLHAVANGIKENYPHFVICLITARDFMKEMIDAMKDKKLHEFQKKYSEKVDVLMIDDIHELKNKESTQNEFFHVFNELYNKGKQLIFTSDKAPHQIDGIEERIKTRLQWGLVVDIQKPDLETRIAILKRKAYELDLYVTDDIITLVACHIKNSIRELEGSLVKLSAFSEMMKVDIDAEMVKEILMIKDIDTDKKITLEQIGKITAQHFKIHLADLKSKSRTKDIAHARFIAMYLSRKILNATQEEIGIFYGGRDHSSVVHAEKTIVKRLETDMSLSKDVIAIETKL
ncbi:chromosomal replication initiator protein DnaA [Bacteriovorax sp. BSW11_IV]|uniref:chromosomal replication initiator protein DnaA n=1 Tax=Bacteriovorax sp. BSW11_IV TaxID=1353529 RepID=UPI000389EB9E|nr:chromosomal replication initiator protein DnaA [Bacteriovorax sp. BSW11_IV]EQC50020.1 chromosomal replication initiator protein DnaA [Bacteriovorax sp. BSW11_IV]